MWSARRRCMGRGRRRVPRAWAAAPGEEMAEEVEVEVEEEEEVAEAVVVVEEEEEEDGSCSW